MKKRIAILLGIIQIFVSVGAIPAGLSMILDPSGSGIGMDTSLLINTPFRDFFVPGLCLFIGHGLFNISGAIISFKRKKSTGTIGIGLGLILLTWICIQVYYVGLIFFLQHLFFIIAIIEIILGYIYLRKI